MEERQTRLQPPPEAAGYYIGYWGNSLATASTSDLNRRISGYEITPVQFAILYRCFIGEADTMTSLEADHPHRQTLHEPAVGPSGEEGPSPEATAVQRSAHSPIDSDRRRAGACAQARPDQGGDRRRADGGHLQG